MPTYTDARKRADKKYTSNTDLLRVRLPKGKKAEIAAHADEMEETMGQFVFRAVNNTIQSDEIKASDSIDDKQLFKCIPQYKYKKERKKCQTNW